MATFVKLTGAYRDHPPTWVNLDLVRRMERVAASKASDYWPEMPERTALWFDQSGPSRDDWDSEDVLETPEQILTASAAEPPCPDPPGECGYYAHYLAYGGPDLTHAGYHAACAIFDKHARACRAMELSGICQTCADGERRIRA